MADFMVMAVHDGVYDVPEDAFCCALVGLAVALEVSVEDLPALAHLHNQIEFLGGLEYLVESDDVWVVYLLQDGDFGPQPVRILHLLLLDDFDGTDLVVAFLDGLDDHSVLALAHGGLLLVEAVVVLDLAVFGLDEPFLLEECATTVLHLQKYQL